MIETCSKVIVVSLGFLWLGLCEVRATRDGPAVNDDLGCKETGDGKRTTTVRGGKAVSPFNI